MSNRRTQAWKHSQRRRALRSGCRRRTVRRSVSRSAACSLGVGSMMNSNAYTSVSGTRARLWLSFTANLDLRARRRASAAPPRATAGGQPEWARRRAGARAAPPQARARKCTPGRPGAAHVIGRMGLPKQSVQSVSHWAVQRADSRRRARRWGRAPAEDIERLLRDVVGAVVLLRAEQEPGGHAQRQQDAAAHQQRQLDRRALPVLRARAGRLAPRAARPPPGPQASRSRHPISQGTRPRTSVAVPPWLKAGY